MAMNNFKLKQSSFILLVVFLLIFVFCGRLMSTDYHFSVVDSVEFPATNYVSHQVYDVDRDGLDELIIMFDICYYVYSFQDDSIFFSDTSYTDTAITPSSFCGFLATDFNDDSITDFLFLENSYGFDLRLYFQDGLNDAAPILLKVIYNVGGLFGTEPSYAGNIFYGDANMNGVNELIIARIRGHVINYGFRIVEYSGFIGLYPEPNWNTNWEQIYSTENSLFIDLNGDSSKEIIAWGMYKKIWYRDEGTAIMSNYKRVGIIDIEGNINLSVRGYEYLIVIGGAINPQTAGDDIIVFKDYKSFDTSVFQPSGNYAIYCLGMPEDSVELLWGMDAEPYQNKLLNLPSIENSFCTSDENGGFSLYSGEDGSVIGAVTGLDNSYITEEGHFIDLPDSTIQVVQINGNKAYLCQLSEPLAVDDKDNNMLPSGYSLSQNRPNPFNPSTTIEYTIPTKSHVNISIYNLIGQRIKTLVDETLTFGVHSVVWDGTDIDNKPVSTGLYFYQIKTESFIESKKMLLLK